MALLMMDGFDCYADREECASSGWSPEDANSGFSTTLGKNGGGCITTGTSSNNRGWCFGMKAQAQGSTLICGFWFRVAAWPATTDDLMTFHSDGQLVVELNITALGEFRVDFNNGVTAGTLSSALIVAGTWHWVELLVVFGTSASNGSYELRVDGSTATSQSSIDTQDAAELITQIQFHAGDAADCRFDDVILMDGTGSDLNTFIGPSYIEALNVDADGGTVDWTRNTGATDVSAVDDALTAADDDTTYVDSSTAAQETRFGIPSPAETGDTVRALQIRARMRKEDAGLRTVRGLMNVNGGTEEILFSEIGLTSNYGWLTLGIRETNDTGGTAWDTTNVALTEIGVEVVV